jgi:hypothetical protein
VQSSNQCENKGLMGEVRKPTPSAPFGVTRGRSETRPVVRAPYVRATYCPRLFLWIHLFSGTERVLVRGQLRSCSARLRRVVPFGELRRHLQIRPAHAMCAKTDRPSLRFRVARMGN